jgi:hypothetical protein
MSQSSEEPEIAGIVIGEPLSALFSTNPTVRSMAREAYFKRKTNQDQAAIERIVTDMMMAIFDERCPGIRWDEKDARYYRPAAIAALKVLGVISQDFE